MLSSKNEERRLVELSNQQRYWKPQQFLRGHVPERNEQTWPERYVRISLIAATGHELQEIEQKSSA